ncbi:hypothetical protein [Roseateles amylovorans]|uniref:Glycosyltransferase family 1 protein n=1 Tax=Roseateles amylovorans TaxID=2978473 RepID=A0ABY6B440_9BURK|nr:hypothetical protein [Roseateles amylovorans]UXH80146.1 hypothetical protein N4261_09800 [Roseateles amylovorans]
MPHANNPAYAGVRLRCLIPNGELNRLGWRSRIVWPGAPLPRQGVMVVQAKWLLDGGSPEALRALTQRLGQARAAGVTLVLDSFDNYFLNETDDPSRRALLEAYREALRLFAAFTVSSPGLKPLLEQELPAGARVLVVGDPVETPEALSAYESWPRRMHPGRWSGHWRAWQELLEHRAARRGARQLMWFGNHGSAYAAGGMTELQRLLPMLERVAERQPLRLTVVSNSEQRYQELLGAARFPHRYRTWDRLHFLRLLGEQDLVLLPSRLTAFTVAKSNNRMLLALAQGVPVMTDPLPDYLPWKDFCAIDEWDRLADHIVDPGALAARASAAMPAIAQQYSSQAIAHDWRDALMSITRA